MQLPSNSSLLLGGHNTGSGAEKTWYGVWRKYGVWG